MKNKRLNQIIEELDENELSILSEKISKKLRTNEQNGIYTRHSLKNADGNYLELSVNINDHWVHEFIEYYKIDVINIPMLLGHICFALDVKDFENLKNFDAVLDGCIASNEEIKED